MIIVSICLYIGLMVSWTYYFSTHGCRRLSSGLAVSFDELAFAAAAACRALLSKKLFIVWKFNWM